MKVEKVRNGSSLKVTVSGRIDALHAPQLESEITSVLDGVTDLSLDIAQTDYISSAGLRVLLSLQQTLGTQGRMVVRNVPAVVQEVFELTGFNDILTIE